MCCRLLPCQFRAALFGALPGPCARAPGADWYWYAERQLWVCADRRRVGPSFPTTPYGASTTRPQRACQGRGGARVLHAHPLCQSGARRQAPKTATAEPPHAATATSGGTASATCALPPIAAHSPAGAHSARFVPPPAPPQQAPRLGRMPPRRTPAAAVPTLTSRAAAARPASAVARLPMVRTPPNAAGGKRTSGRDGRGAICWSSVGHLLTIC